MNFSRPTRSSKDAVPGQSARRGQVNQARNFTIDKAMADRRAQTATASSSAQPSRDDFLRYIMSESGIQRAPPINDGRFGRGGSLRPTGRIPSPNTMLRRAKSWEKDKAQIIPYRAPASSVTPSEGTDSALEFGSEVEEDSESDFPAPFGRPVRRGNEDYEHDRPSSARERIVKRLSISKEGTEAAVEEITAQTSSFLGSFLTSPLFRQPAAAVLILLFLWDVLPTEYTGNYYTGSPVRWWLLIPVLWLLRLDKAALFVLGIAQAVLVGFARGIGAFGRDMCILFLILSVLSFHFFVLLFTGPLGFLVVFSITWTLWYFCFQGLFRSWRRSRNAERRRRERRRSSGAYY
ncbi:hypothetical protein V8F20_012707 [Naviculisporaceae sp. PSN 640]